MKHFKKFYEIGNNRYYTVVADDEMFLATESYINLGRKRLFRKQDYLTQGFKLLKFSTPVAVLFNFLDNVVLEKGQKDVAEDMLMYKKIDNRELKVAIESYYDEAFGGQIKELEDWLVERTKDLKQKYKDKQISKALLEEGIEAYEKEFEKHRFVINKNNPLKNGMLDLTSPKHTGCNIVRSMLASGLEHLYTERVTAFANNIFLYEQDCFGTLTIYRITTVKNVVKTIDTFIYDKKLVSTFLQTMYENDEKEGK
jgi:hypothetical protein